MTDKTDDCIKCMAIVQAHRERSALYFPLPTPAECIRYAMQELAELDDAWMRQENPEHKRNNGRAHDPLLELGQVGYMLGSAIVKTMRPGDFWDYAIPRDRTQMWATVMYKCASSLSVQGMDVCPPFVQDALWAWVGLCRLLDAEPAALLDKEAQRIDQKWGQKVTA